MTKAPPQKDWMDINEIIGEVIAFLRPELHAERVGVQMQLSDELPTVLGDRIQLQQVLLNIVMNAIEAIRGAGEGPRTLVLRTDKHDAQHILVAVQDSGPGIDAGHLDQPFEAFYSTKPRGLGMGLAISRSIIEAHGGRLWATANESRGATFQFTLPIQSEKPA
jgi:signal transduction histidine kinase